MLVYGEKSEEGLFILKNYLDKFAEKFSISLKIENWKLEIREYMHPGRCGGIYYKEELIGEIYEVHPMIAENLGLKNRAWIMEINLEKLVGDAKNIEDKFTEIKSDMIFKEFSRFEVSKRDIAVIVDANTDNSAIINEIKGVDNRVVGAELFDEYVNDKFGAGKKSVAFHLTFQASDKTLTDKEADELFNKVLEILNTKFNAEIRR
jgi:phenylalanyl-tRNA synthetase beta chain